MLDKLPESFQPEALAAGLIVNGLCTIVERGIEKKDRKEQEVKSLQTKGFQTKQTPYGVVESAIVSHLQLDSSKTLVDLLKDPVVSKELCNAFLYGSFDSDSNEILKGLEIDSTDIDSIKQKVSIAIAGDQVATNLVLASKQDSTLEEIREQRGEIREVLDNQKLSTASFELQESLKQKIGDLASDLFVEAESFASKENFELALQKYKDCYLAVENSDGDRRGFIVKVLLRIASQHAIMKDVENCESHIELAKKEGANSEQLKEAEAFLCSHTGNDEEALKIYKALATLHDKDLYYENVVILHIRLKQVSECKEWVNKLPDSTSNASGLKSVYYDEVGDYDRALEWGKKAIELNSDNIRAKFSYHLMVLSLHDKAARVATFQQGEGYASVLIESFGVLDEILGRDNQFIEIADDELIETYRANTLAYATKLNLCHSSKKTAIQLRKYRTTSLATQNLCQWLIRVGDRAAALEVVLKFEGEGDEYEGFRHYVLVVNHQYDEVLKYYKDHEARLCKLDVWVELVAICYWENHERKEAKKFCEDLLDDEIVGLEARLQLASLLVKGGDYEKAELEFRAIMPERCDVAIVSVFANILMERTKLPEAYNLLNEHGASEAYSPLVSDFLSVVYELEEDAECIQTVASLEAAGRTKEFYAVIRCASLYRSGNAQDCLEWIKKYRSQGFNGVKLVELEARCHFHLSNPDKALSALQMFEERGGELDKHLQMFSSHLLVQCGRYEDALSLALQLVRKEPDDIDLRCNLVRVAFESEESYQFGEEDLKFIQDNFGIVTQKTDLFTPIHLKEKADGSYDFSELFNLIEKRDTGIKKFKNICDKHNLPYGCLANFAGKKTIETFRAIRPKLLTGEGSIRVKTAEAILSHGVVLDVSSIVTLHQFGGLELLIDSEITVYVTQSLIDELRELLGAFYSKASSHISTAPKGKFLLTETPQGQVNSVQSVYAEIIALLLRPNVVKKTCITPDHSSKQLLKFEEEYGSTFDALHLAKEREAIFVCDDERLRSWSISNHSQEAISTLLLIRGLHEELNLASTQIIDITRKLHSQGFTVLGFTTCELKILLTTKDTKQLNVLFKELKKGEYTRDTVLTILADVLVWSICSEVVNDRTYQVSWILKVAKEAYGEDKLFLRLLILSSVAQTVTEFSWYKILVPELVNNNALNTEIHVPAVIIQALDLMVRSCARRGLMTLAYLWYDILMAESTIYKCRLKIR